MASYKSWSSGLLKSWWSITGPLKSTSAILQWMMGPSFSRNLQHVNHWYFLCKMFIPTWLNYLHILHIVSNFRVCIVGALVMQYGIYWNIIYIFPIIVYTVYSNYFFITSIIQSTGYLMAESCFLCISVVSVSVWSIVKV